MKSFVIYNSEGTIVSHGQCADQDLGLQAPPGFYALEAVFEPNKKVVDGVLVDHIPTNESLTNTAMIQLRIQRASYLSWSDWTQVPDSPLTAEQRSAWQMYRQALRDLPEDFAHVTSIDDVVFPDPPL